MNDKIDIVSACLEKTKDEGRFPIYSHKGDHNKLKTMSGFAYYRAKTSDDKVRVGVTQHQNGTIYIFCRSKSQYLNKMKRYCENLGFSIEPTHDKIGKELKTTFKFKVENTKIDNLLKIQTNILDHFENL